MSDVPGTTRETVELDLDYQMEASESLGGFACMILLG